MSYRYRSKPEILSYTPFHFSFTVPLKCRNFEVIDFTKYTYFSVALCMFILNCKTLRFSLQEVIEKTLIAFLIGSLPYFDHCVVQTLKLTYPTQKNDLFPDLIINPKRN